MRAVLPVLFLLVTPAQAWVFTATPVCTILNNTPDLSLRVTFDPALPAPYSITLTRPTPWPQTETFGLRFDGPAALSIGTARHQLSGNGLSLTVTDTGFGNVLDGMEFNATATAIAGSVALALDLAGAAPVVQAFRACIVQPSA